MRAAVRHRPGESPPWLALLTVLLPLAALKLAYSPALGHHTLDGNYYFNIAGHVAAGDGLVSDISLYNQGFPSFPHRVTISPLWPLTLGMAGRTVPLLRAAEWLPEVLYLVDLLLLAVLVRGLARALVPAGDPPRLLPGLPRQVSPELLLVALLGLNPVFFRFTSLPYTEGLAFALLLGALVCLERADPGRPGIALLSGVLAGAAFLTRSQAAGLVVALPLAYAVSGSPRRHTLRQAGLCGLGTAAVILPQVAYLASWATPFSPLTLGVFEHYRASAVLDPFPHRVSTDGVLGFLVDRLQGFAVAFSPASRQSYLALFGPAALVVPAAGLALLGRGRGASLPGAPSDARGRRIVVGTVAAGIGLLLPVHEAHLRFFLPWLFGHRHGLPLVLLIAPATLYLWARRPRVGRVAVGALLVSVVMSGALLAMQWSGGQASGFTASERQLGRWLDSVAPRAVLSTRAQALSLLTGAGIHWTACSEPPHQTRAFVRELAVEAVVRYPDDRGCAFLDGADSLLVVARVFDDGVRPIAVLRPRGPDTEVPP